MAKEKKEKKAKKEKKKIKRSKKSSGSSVETIARETGRMAAKATTLVGGTLEAAKSASAAVGDLVVHPSHVAGALSAGGAKVSEGAGELLELIEQRFVDLIKRIGVPTSDQLRGLEERIGLLEAPAPKRSAKRSASGSKSAPKKAAAKPAAKAATKPTATKAASKPAAKKAAAKPAAKPAATKTAARKTTPAG